MTAVAAWTTPGPVIVAKGDQIDVRGTIATVAPDQCSNVDGVALCCFKMANPVTEWLPALGIPAQSRQFRIRGTAWWEGTSAFVAVAQETGCVGEPERAMAPLELVVTP